MTDLVTGFRNHLVGRRRAVRTVATYAGIATSFLATGTDEPFTLNQVETFLGRSRQNGARRASTTYNQELAALRALATYAVREQYWPTNPTIDIPFVREAQYDPVVLTVDELHRLFHAVATSEPARERVQLLAIIGLLSQTALRVHELVALDVAQVDLVTQTLVGVHGKGGTVHSVPLSDPATLLLTSWLEVRADRVAPTETALFVSVQQRRLAIRTVEQWFVDLRQATGLVAKITPHTLRHSAATLALALNIDLPTVQRLLRHADIRTTTRYIHLGDAHRRRAVQRLAVAIPPDVLSHAALGKVANVLLTESTDPGLRASPQPPVSPSDENACDQYRFDAAA